MILMADRICSKAVTARVGTVRLFYFPKYQRQAEGGEGDPEAQREGWQDAQVGERLEGGLGWVARRVYDIDRCADDVGLPV